MSRNIIFVAIGGMLGSVLRYLLSTFIVQVLPFPFPFGTFVVNLIGCFVMGAAVGYADGSLWFNDEWRILITAGLCGGFTTFSAMSLEGFELLNEGRVEDAWQVLLVSENPMFPLRP